MTYEYIGNYTRVGNPSGTPGYTPSVNLPHPSPDPVAPGPASHRGAVTIDARTGQAFADATANAANGAWHRALGRVADPQQRDHLAFLLGTRH
jgi:hypothetical protein